MLYDSLSEAIEHVTFPSPSSSSSSSSSSPLLLQSAWAKQALTGVSETYVTVEDDEGEDAVRSFFEEGRDWREGEMERMEIELEEVRTGWGGKQSSFGAHPLTRSSPPLSGSHKLTLPPT
jgi:hypothetical protein